MIDIAEFIIGPAEGRPDDAHPKGWSVLRLLRRELPSGARPCYAPGMIKLSCLCGQVDIRISKKPDYINECNCTLCSKSGARWGYFHPSQVNVEGATLAYSRNDKADPNAQIHFCRDCGATTHFVLTESAISRFGKNSLMGVNMWLADASDLAGIELRYPDGRAWSGEGGGFGYVQDARIIGDPVVRSSA